MRRNSTAFTLIELLIVVAIIAVLAALIAAGASQVRGTANSQKCMGNLHQIGIALTLYVNENNGYYPPRFDEDGSAWRQKLNPYLGLAPTDPYGKSKVWYCPSAEVMPPALKDHTLVAHYGYNYVIVNSRWKRKATAPPFASKEVIVGEMNKNSDSFTWSASPSFAGDVETPYRFSHPGHTANFLFADGHLETIRYVDSSHPSTDIFIWW